MTLWPFSPPNKFCCCPLTAVWGLILEEVLEWVLEEGTVWVGGVETGSDEEMEGAVVWATTMGVVGEGELDIEPDSTRIGGVNVKNTG